MNNLPDDRTRLLAETLDGEWAAGPAAAMARRAAAHARRRRAVKRVSVSLAAVAVVGTALVLSRRTPSASVLPAPSVASVAAVPVAAHAGYEIISDDELVAQLKDRPLLVLPQENGMKKIVLLDR